MPLPVQPYSAVDAITPAVGRASKQLFSPIRWAFWWRMAVLAVFTGEVSSGGVNFPSSFNFPQQPPQNGAKDLIARLPWDWNSLTQALPWLAALALCAVLLFLFFLYVHSVLRFVLFEAVINGRCSLRDGWRRWRGIASQYFLWLIAFQLVVLAGLSLLVGIPLLVAWQRGIFNAPKDNMPVLIAGGLVLFFVLFVFAIVAAAIQVLAKDFVIPMMALEGVSALEGWRRLWSKIETSKGPYAGYLGMKLLLAFGVAIALAMLNLAIIVILLIPAVAVFLLLVAIKGVAAVLLGILFAMAGFLLMIALFAFTAVPSAVFFQAYALYFFGSRYEPLSNLMWPPLPPPLPSPPDMVPAAPLPA